MINVHQKLAHLGGGDEAALDLVPSARPAFVQVAVALLVTASVAATSMWFAVHDALHVHWLGAGVMALFWFIVILGIDRTLTLLGMGGGRGATIVSVTGRLMAAVLIGVVVSTPLTLRMFASDIDAQIAEIQASQSATNKTWIADSQQQERVDELAQQVDDWENIGAGVLPVSFADEDSSAVANRIATLQERLPRLRHAADQAAILYNCDTYGGGRSQLDHPEKCAPAPGENGNSALYRAEADAAAQAVVDATATLATLQQQVDDAHADKLAALQAQAPGELATLRPQLAAAREALADFSNGIEDANSGDTGLLAQLRALWKAGEESTVLMAAHLLIALLFVVIEVLPVMAKLLWRLSPSARAYEEAVRSFDERGVAKAQTIRAHAQIQAETSYEADLVTKDATLDRVQLEAEHAQDLLRIEQRAEIEIAEARTQRIAAMGIAVDDELAQRREAELRRRAEEEFDAWASRPARRPAGNLFSIAGLAGSGAEGGAQTRRRWWGQRRTAG